MPIDGPQLPATELLWEQAPCGLLVTTDNGTVLRANRTIAHWLGVSQDSLIGQRLQNYLSKSGQIFHQTHWGPLLHLQGSIAEIKLDLMHCDGRTVPMMLNGQRRWIENTVFQEFSLFIAEDRQQYERELINARLLAEQHLISQLDVQQALTQAQADLRSAVDEAEQRAIVAERMVAIASHDLRNPLSAIKMAAETLQRQQQPHDLPGEPRHARMVSHISSSVDRAQRMIADLLDFTLAQVGRGITVVPEPLDLHASVSAVVDELRIAFAPRDLVHQQFGEGLFTADGDRLHQMLGNLVANAIAYGDPDTVVTIVSRFDDQSVTLSVHNLGKPIPSNLIEHLFEPLTRGHQASPDRRNIGLGLFIVLEIAKAHHGDVAVISTEELGTTFIARLPRRR